MNWTDCTDDGCQIHLSEKQGSGWYPQFARRSRKPSVAHDNDWRQEMEANPGEDWVPQQPRRKRARRAHHEITSWEHCFNDNCNEHRWGKVDAGYYPRQIGEKGELSKNNRREHKKRRAVRTRLGGEGSEKTIPNVEALEGKISDLRSQLDRAAQIIVAKDNDLERLDKEKEKLQQAYNRCKQRMRQIAGMLWKEGVWYRGTDARGGRELMSQTVTKQGRLSHD